MVIRGKAILKNITIEQAYSHIYDIELRKSWDLIFAEFRKIKQIDSNTDIIYTYIKVIKIISI